MFENLTILVNRLEELSQHMFDSVVAADAKEYAELVREYKDLEPIVEKYRKYLKAVQTVEDSTKILGESGLGHEIREMIQQELDDTKDQVERTTEGLKVLLPPHDPNDEYNMIMKIRGGAGDEGAALFSARLLRMYSIYVTRRGWKTELLNVDETELGRYKEISFQITGDGVYSRLKYEGGIHRVQHVPETETRGRVHASTVTVAVLPEVDDVEIEINPTDLQIDAYRTSDASGQHINKTESATRITHLSTGAVVECQDERNQFKNKDKTMKVLRSRLYEAKQRERNAQVVQQRKSQAGMGDRSERVRTCNFPQGRLTDHRIGLIIYRSEGILSDDLDEVINTLITTDHIGQLEGTIDRQE